MNNPAQVLGIDEAGRGCVLGPLCMAGVLTRDSDDLQFLISLGVADSKSYGAGAKARKQRQSIADKIKTRLEHCIFEISPSEIDEAVRKNGLNELERKYAKKIINKIPAKLTIMDGARIFAPLNVEGKVISLNKADVTHPQVMAASILAKTMRDELLIKIFEEEFGLADIAGGGYPNARTAKTLVEYYEEKGQWPESLRKSYRWDPKRYFD